MKSNLSYGLAALLLVGSGSSCTTSGKLSKRYRSADYHDGSVKEFVAVSGYSPSIEPAPAAKPKSIFDLSENAQAELIKQLAANEKDNTKLLTALSGNLSAKNQTSVEVLDLTRFSKRVVISVDKLSSRDDDRISKIWVGLSLPDNTKLLSCDRLETKYEVLNISKQNYSNSLTAGLTGTAGTGITTTVNAGNTSGRTIVANDGTVYNDGVGTTSTGGGSSTGTRGSTSGVSATGTGNLGVTGNVSGNMTFAEERQLSNRIATLQASITKNDLKIFQQGEAGRDLVGNVIADIVFDWKDDIQTEQLISFSDLTDNAGGLNKSSQIKVKDFVVIFPRLDADIEGKLNFRAVFRKVKNGGTTTSESDDDAEYITGVNDAVTNTVKLVDEGELRPKMWTINLPAQGSKLPLEIATPSSNGKGVMVFNSATQARAFIVWLKSSYAAIAGDAKLGTLGHKLFLPSGLSYDAKTMNQLSLGIY